jgi:hypothetical protein
MGLILPQRTSPSAQIAPGKLACHVVSCLFSGRELHRNAPGKQGKPAAPGGDLSPKVVEF